MNTISRPRLDGYKRFEKMLHKPRLVKDLMRLTESSERSVYRWLAELIADGRPVVRVPGTPAMFYLDEKRKKK